MSLRKLFGGLTWLFYCVKNIPRGFFALLLPKTISYELFTVNIGFRISMSF